MNRVLTLATTLSLALAGGAAMAAENMDTDGDGAVSFEEMLAVYPATTEEDFGTMDTDADGMLSAEELAAAEEAGLIPSEG
ncbi:MAG: EF-hand domain-containing protein [Rhodobacteraceae bacterium]|nr:EF-hand domain-containing protein [Paracoccaceae bacterium]